MSVLWVLIPSGQSRHQIHQKHKYTYTATQKYTFTGATHTSVTSKTLIYINTQKYTHTGATQTSNTSKTQICTHTQAQQRYKIHQKHEYTLLHKYTKNTLINKYTQTANTYKID